jgi:hypothetical protein
MFIAAHFLPAGFFLQANAALTLHRELRRQKSMSIPSLSGSLVVFFLNNSQFSAGLRWMISCERNSNLACRVYPRISDPPDRKILTGDNCAVCETQHKLRSDVDEPVWTDNASMAANAASVDIYDFPTGRTNVIAPAVELAATAAGRTFPVAHWIGLQLDAFPVYSATVAANSSGRNQHTDSFQLHSAGWRLDSTFRRCSG